MSQTEGGNSKKCILAVDDSAIILTRISNTRTMEDREDIPVIMLTGVEDKDVVVESARLGIDDYILKPFYSDELIKRIRRVIDQEEQ